MHHLQPPALLLPLMEPGLGGLRLQPVPLPLSLPALLLLAVLRLHLVEGGQLLPLQGQRALLLLLQQSVAFVAPGQGGPLQLQLPVAVPLRDDGLRKDRRSDTDTCTHTAGVRGRGSLTCRL